ncbi:MAG: hypothetical protein JNN15_16455 [Blastocatellia bacterium]|nr:hypothetical protein [Blastocatellia bacterium]
MVCPFCKELIDSTASLLLEQYYPIDRNHPVQLPNSLLSNESRSVEVRNEVKRKGNVLAVVVLVILLVVPIVSYTLYINKYGFSARINQALATNHIFEPAGESVFDIYYAEKRSAADSQELRSAAVKIEAKLAPEAANNIDRWYKESDQSINWRYLEKVHAFLYDISSKKQELQAIKDYCKGQTAFESGDYDLAITCYINALKSSDKKIKALAQNAIGRTYLQSNWPYNNEGQAIEAYKQASSIDPDFLWAPYNLANYYIRKNEWIETSKWLLKAWEISPKRSFLEKRMKNTLTRLKKLYTKEKDPDKKLILKQQIDELSNKIEL